MLMLMFVVVNHHQEVVKIRLQSREWSISSNDAETCLVDVFDAVATTKLHATLELQVERLEHEFNSSLAVVLRIS